MGSFNFGTAEVIANPYPMFDSTRHLSPLRLAYPGPGEVWSVLTFDHVNRVLRDHESFSSANFGDFGSELFRLVLINDDPPRHTRLRRAVAGSFSRRSINSISPRVEAVIEARLDAIGQEPVEFMGEFARMLPLRTILSLLGIPDDEFARFRGWVHNLVQLTGQEQVRRLDLIADMVAYLEALISMRSSDPLDEVIRPLLDRDSESGGFTEAEALGYVILLLVAGTETTTYLLGNAVNLLANNSELWKQLRDTSELIDEFIEETLRFESPVQLLPRRATQDVELGGKRIPKGALVFVQYGSANRDPAVFSAPEQFRMDRGLSSHVAFGAGVHFCLGSPLARCQVRLVLQALLRRYDHIEPDGLPVRQGTAAGFFGFDSLPLRFVAAK